MLRTVRLIDAGTLSAVVLLVGACAESGPTAPTRLFRSDLITCDAVVSAGTLTCNSSQPLPGSQAQRASGLSFNLVLGGQGALVRLASSGTAYNSGTQAFTSNVTVENLINQPMNTANGTTADTGGVKVFFNSGPTATGGSGVITVANADGTGDFTQTGQKFFKYNSGTMLASGSTTSAKTWNFTVPNTVTKFEFQVLVTTRLHDEVSPIVALGLSRSPSALTIAPGGSGTPTVLLTRTNFTGAVTLSLTGAPSGVTGSFSPSAPTGASSTLTLNVGSSVTTGTYNLTINGASTAGPRSTALTLTVATGGTGNVTVDFSGCAVADKPTWVAAKNGGGAWTHITGTSDVYNFTIGSSGGGLAYVVTGASGAATLTVQFLTQGEFTAGTFVTCPPPLSGKTINGSVAGLVAFSDEASITLGGGQPATTFDNITFQLNDVPDGNQDLVAYRHSLIGGAEAAIIRRSQNFADNSTIPVLDFSAVEAFTPASATITLNGLLGGEEVLQQMSYQVNANCATAILYSGGAGATFTAFGIPGPEQVVTEFHGLQVSATTSTGFRSMTQYNHTFMARTLTLGAVLPAPTITDLGGLYKRLQAVYTLPTDYEGFTSFGYSGGNRSVSITATFGFLGSTSVTLALPDFSAVAGWDNSFAPAPGGTANWNLTGTSPFASACSEGATFKNASETGTF